MPYLHKLSVRQARLCAAAAGLVVTACTVTDRSIIGPGEVSQVVVSPDSISIDPGQTVSFQAVGRTAAGGTQPVTVRWQATGGGKIDANGTYLADSTPGNFEVRALLDQPNLVGRAKVHNRGNLKQVVLNPPSMSVPPGGQAQFNAYGQVASGDTVAVAVTYNVTGGTITAAGLYIAGPASGSFRVIATQQGGTLADTAAVTIDNAAPTLTQVVLLPASATLATGGSQLFRSYGRLSNGDSVAVTVNLTATGGTITAAGLYTAGQTPGTYRVIATQQGGTLADTAALTISGAAPTLTQVVLTPAAAALSTGGSQLFRAYGRMSNGDSVAVSVGFNATGGTISSAGLYTAGQTAGTFRVIATQAGGTLADTSSVAISSTALSGCLSQSGPLVTISGSQSSGYNGRGLAASTKIDARTASWDGVVNNPVQVGAPALCWSGALIKGAYSASTSWAAMHDAYALNVYSAPGATIEGVRIHNYGDGINFNSAGSDGWTIRGVHISIGRDDCISNDFGNSGLIDDNLIDGCYVGYSSRPYTTVADNSGKVVTVRNTLWRLVDMPTGYSQPGHGKFWKMDPLGNDPRLSLHDNIFRVDTPANCCGDFLIPPPSYLVSCSNNIIVWLGAGEFPEPVPPCFTLTRDRAVWDNAVANWRARHPQNAQQFSFP